MSAGRILGSLAASAAVAGCAVVALGMSRAGTSPSATDRPMSASPTSASQAPAPSYRVLTWPVAGGTVGTSVASSSAPAPLTSATKPRPAATTSSAPQRVAPKTSARPAPRTSARTTAPAPKPPATTPSSRAPAPQRGGALPLGYSTGSATRVITVFAAHTWSTTATLQAWTKAPGGGWLKYGSAVTAHIGSQGMSTAPSESKSATPMGSFTLTQAFGRNADPGTPLPYFRTTPADWWISQSGSLYNTHQRCSSGCGFAQGSPNEHLYYETPYYNYAVVIDYNTRNAPGGVRQGAGSAFFLHVTDGSATAGCVAIPQSTLISLMKWLSPGTHPRILIGT